MKTEYKGFEIEYRRQYATTIYRFFVNAPGFREDGYATENTAKGAITNKLKASEAETEHLLASPANATHLANSLAQVTTGDVVRVPFVIDMNNLMQVMRYHGHIKANGKPRKQDKRSRSKREGFYSGTEDGKPQRFKTGNRRVLFSMVSGYYQPTRKHRKEGKMEYRKSLSDVTYGGNIKEFANKF